MTYTLLFKAFLETLAVKRLTRQCLTVFQGEVFEVKDDRQTA